MQHILGILVVINVLCRKLPDCAKFGTIDMILRLISSIAIISGPIKIAILVKVDG